MSKYKVRIRNKYRIIFKIPKYILNAFARKTNLSKLIEVRRISV